MALFPFSKEGGWELSPHQSKLGGWGGWDVECSPRRGREPEDHSEGLLVALATLGCGMRPRSTALQVLVPAELEAHGGMWCPRRRRGAGALSEGAGGWGGWPRHQHLPRMVA